MQEVAERTVQAGPLALGPTLAAEAVGPDQRVLPATAAGLHEPIPTLEVYPTELPPLLRDPDVSYYLRQEGRGLLLGPYEPACRTWRSPSRQRDPRGSWRAWRSTRPTPTRGSRAVWLGRDLVGTVSSGLIDTVRARE
jgi:hypothetical protein